MECTRLAVFGIERQRILQKGDSRLVRGGSFRLLDGVRDLFAPLGGLSFFLALTVARNPAFSGELLQLNVSRLELQRAFEDFDGGLV